MTLEFGKSRLLLPALLATSIGLIGCGGSSSDNGDGGGGDNGDGGGDTSDAGITVLPERFDFGRITEPNLDQVEPQQFVISNTGTTPYNISNIRLAGTDPDKFSLNERGGDEPCDALSFSLSPDESCTVEVGFTPGDDFAEFSAALFVENNDPNPTIARALSGTFAEIQEINVAINQVNACPRDPARVFVAVTDDGGFPLTGLQAADFTLAEDDGTGGGFGAGAQPAGADTTDSAPFDVNLSASLVMDYSGSIADVPEFRENMEDAAKTLVNSMTDGDEAEVIKYRSEPQITQEFTEDVNLLLEAIDRDPNLDGETALFDAVDVAVERISVREKPRRVVIALTDGQNNNGLVDLDGATNGAADADVPVFTVGFGDVNTEDLQSLAEDTGGVFYNPPASDNLEATYTQIANLLFQDQYVLTYGSALPADGGDLRVTVEFDKPGDATVLTGTAEKTVQACP